MDTKGNLAPAHVRVAIGIVHIVAIMFLVLRDHSHVDIVDT